MRAGGPCQTGALDIGLRDAIGHQGEAGAVHHLTHLEHVDADDLVGQATALHQADDLGAGGIAIAQQLVGVGLRKALVTGRDDNDLAARAAHFEPKFEVVQEGVSIQVGSSALTSLEEEFVSYLDRYPIDNVDKDTLKLCGLEYLKRGLEGSD